MILYRIAKAAYAEDLSGVGAEKYGGRWNRKGIPALYLAENISLALLETIVHSQYIHDLHGRLILSVEIPNVPILTPDEKTFLKDWNTTPWKNYTVETGTALLKQTENYIIKLPSAVIPSESIYILNPRNPIHTKAKIVKKEIFQADNRLALYAKKIGKK